MIRGICLHRSAWSCAPVCPFLCYPQNPGGFLETTGRSIAQRDANAIFARWYNGKGQVESIWTYHGMWDASVEVIMLVP